VGAFVDDFVFDACEAVEDHCAGAAFDVVDGGLSQGEEQRGGDGPPADVVEDVGSSHRVKLDGAGVVDGYRGMGVLMLEKATYSRRRSTFPMH
jgi:hypothetical protein